MRILHISTRLILGGSQENTVLSCEGQARMGHRVHLAYGPIYGPEGSLLSRIEAFNARCRSGEERLDEGARKFGFTPGGEVCPISVHVVPHLVREVNPWRDWRCYRELKVLISRIGPDVVHTHSSKAGILGRLAAWSVMKVHRKQPSMMLAGTLDRLGFQGGGGLGREGQGEEPKGNWSDRPKVIHTIHGPPFMPVEGGAVHRMKVRVWNAVYTWAEKLAARRCHKIVCVADAMREQFLERGIGEKDQYITVYSGMEVGEFAKEETRDSRKILRARLGFGEADVVIGTVARLAQHKGHDDVLDALGEMMKRDSHLRLLWVGDGWWRERLIEKARRLGLACEVRTLDHPASVSKSNIVCTGLIVPEQVPAAMSAMDVLVHASYREGLPRTVPQALLSSVCPVAYDVDGTGEICREMETGRLVAKGDIAALRDAVQWCIENPVARGALAQRGRLECMEKFSAQTMVKRLHEVYGS